MNSELKQVNIYILFMSSLHIGNISTNINMLDKYKGHIDVEIQLDMLFRLNLSRLLL